jgi:hypothetical protein
MEEQDKKIIFPITESKCFKCNASMAFDPQVGKYCSNYCWTQPKTGNQIYPEQSPE